MPNQITIAILSAIPLIAGAPKTLSTEQLYQKCAARVVMIESINQRGETFSQGSGVIIDGENIITNKHVIDGASGLRLKQSNKIWIADEILIDPSIDLALIKCKTGNSPIPYANSKSLKIGQKIFAIGNPIGLESSISDGIISNIRYDSKIAFIQTTAPISPGSSGGGLFTSQGAFAGITTFTFKNGQNINFAISTDEITPLLLRAVPYRHNAISKTNKTPTTALQTLQGMPNSQLIQEALKDNSYAQEQLGLRFSMGADIVNGQFISNDQAIDKSKYVYWCSKAAENGNINAAIGLGMNYYNGINVEANDFEAKRMFLLALDGLSSDTNDTQPPPSAKTIESTLLTISVPLSGILMKDFAQNRNQASGATALVWCQITNLLSSKQHATRTDATLKAVDNWEMQAFESSSKVLAMAVTMFGNDAIVESREKAIALLRGFSLKF